MKNHSDLYKKFFILGYYGWHNTGDDAMLYALVSQLNLRYPNSSFCILSRIPVFVPKSLKNSTKFVNHNSFIEVIWEIINSSTFIMGGGTHLYDYGDKKNRLFRLAQMLILFIIAKIFSTNIILISIGLEHPVTLWGRFLIKNTCRLADSISLRDNNSYEIALNEYELKNVTKSFDLAVLLENSSLQRRNLENNSIILGVSILPFYSIYYNNTKKDRLILHHMADAIINWLKRDKNSLIHLFVIKGKSNDDDFEFTKKLQQLIDSERVKLINYNEDPLETLSKFYECSAFLGMRYHSCLFAYISKLPMIIIDYAEKNRALAEDIHLDKHSVIKLESILNGNLKKILIELQDNPEKFLPQMPVKIKKEEVINFIENLED